MDPRGFSLTQPFLPLFWEQAFLCVCKVGWPLAAHTYVGAPGVVRLVVRTEICGEHRGKQKMKPQESFKTDQERLPSGPRRPKRAPGRPTRAPRRPKRGFPQNAKTRQGGSRGLKRPPGGPRETPKRPPRRPQQGPRSGQHVLTSQCFYLFVRVTRLFFDGLVHTLSHAQWTQAALPVLVWSG